MPWENPWVYNEARNRIKENKERETIVIEEKKESFEKWKEKIRSKKKLDVFELKRRIETGQSLELLKGDIKEALDRGEISVDTYKDALKRIEGEDVWDERNNIPDAIPDYVFDPKMYPLANNELTKYFESQKIGENIFVDMGGFMYGLAQWSLFLLWLAGRVVLDALLLPIDLYKLISGK